MDRIATRKIIRLILPVFLVTFSTVDRSAFRGFEWNFTFFTTVGTNCFVHCSWAAVSASLVTHFPTSLSTLVIQKIAIKNWSFCMLSKEWCSVLLNLWAAALRDYRINLITSALKLGEDSLSYTGYLYAASLAT